MNAHPVRYRILLLLTAAGLGLALGVTLRARAGRPVAKSSVPPSIAPAKQAGGRKARVGIRVGDDSPLAAQLEKDLALSSGVTRWLHWLAALEKAGPSDFPRLAGLARGNRAACRLLAIRWAAVAPRYLFDTLVRAPKEMLETFPFWEWARVLFDAWSKSDPEAAIAALNEPGDYGTRGSLRDQLATAILRTDVERSLRLLADWHIESYDPGMGPVAKWADADPRHAAEFTLQNSLGYVAHRAAETIGQEWAKTDPAAALAFAGANPGVLGSALGSAALKQWAEGNLADAAQWLAAADAQTRNRLSPAFVEAWAQKDAAGALAWCDEDLAGSSLAQAVAGVMKGAAEKDVAGAAALVAAMDPSAARSEAAVAVARKWFPEMSSGDAAKPEAVAWLAGLDPNSIRRALQECAVLWGWASADPKSMAAFLASASPGEIPADVYSTLAREMVRQSPATTLEWASHLPADYGFKAGSAAYAAWWTSQPDTATQWLNALPANDARRQPFFQSAIQTLAYHPQAVEQLAALSPADRTAARSVIEPMSLPEPRRATLLKALASP